MLWKSNYNAWHGRANRTARRCARWDAADGAYYSEAEPVYDSVISADVLVLTARII